MKAPLFTILSDSQYLAIIKNDTYGRNNNTFSRKATLNTAI